MVADAWWDPACRIMNKHQKGSRPLGSGIIFLSTLSSYCLWLTLEPCQMKGTEHQLVNSEPEQGIRHKSQPPREGFQVYAHHWFLLYSLLLVCHDVNEQPLSHASATISY